MSRSIARAVAISINLFALAEQLCAQVDAIGPEEGVKGSLLIFPQIEIRWDQNGNLLQDTFLRISNDFPDDVFVHLYFLNGDPPLPGNPNNPAEPGWNIYDSLVNLTQNQPIYWSALSGNPAGVNPFTTLDPGTPPGRPEPLPNSTARVLRGAAFAWAEAFDPDTNMFHEISWNHLKGDATIVNYQFGYVSEYGAYSFPTVLTGQPGAEPDGVRGQLLLNDVKYIAPHARLMFDFAADGTQAWSSDLQLAIVGGQLTMMPVGMDFRQDGNGPITAQVNFTVFNEQEVQFGGGRCITCWDQRITNGYSPNLFEMSVLGSDVGRASIQGVTALPGCTGVGQEVVPLLAVQTHRVFFIGAPLGLRADFASGTVVGSGQQSAVIRFDPTEGPGEISAGSDDGSFENKPAITSVEPDEPLAGIAALDERVGLNVPGSLLVFPKVELRWDSDGNLTGDTFIQISNDYPAPVNVKLVFVNGEPPIPAQGEPGWNHIQSTLALTQNQPVYWSAWDGPPGGVSFSQLDPGFPPGRIDPDGSGDRLLRGYLLAWAIDDVSGFEINWNHLTGRATTVSYKYGFAWDYPAYAHRAIAGNHGDETDEMQSQLLLDGTEYDYAFDQLVFNFQSSYSEAFSNSFYAISDTELVLMPLGLDLSPVTGFPAKTKALFEIWNENEVRFSGANYCITCWDLTYLATIAPPNSFLFSTLQTDAARARVQGIQSSTCPGSTGYPLVGTISKHVVMDIGTTGQLFVVTAGGTSVAGLGNQSATIGEQLCSKESACGDNNACTCNTCTLQHCTYTPVRFGDVNCSEGDFPDLDDILCVLSGFSNLMDCPNADIAPTTGEYACWGNRIVDLDDILAVLGAFAGADPCACNG